MKLLELCGLFGTLVIDEDGIYDMSDFNDRLLIGLKGTMGEAEYASRQNLEYFDHYCADNFDCSSMPIQAMIDGWCIKRDRNSIEL